MRTNILYEDKELLVCEKPAGLAVQSGRVSESDMVSELKNYLAGQDCVKTGKDVYLGIVHRLDQPVSGVLVFARTKQAAADLSRQIAQQEMKKIYRAIVLNHKADTAGREGRLTDYLIKEPHGGSRIAEPQEKGAKKAVLAYRILSADGRRALLEVELFTGRHHQIRAQLAHAGMPLLGDNRYGTIESKEISRRLETGGIALQAVRLSFRHPASGNKVCYELDQKLEL